MPANKLMMVNRVANFVAIVVLAAACEADLPQRQNNQSRSASPGGTAPQVDVGSADREASVKSTVEKYWSVDASERYLLLTANYKSSLRRLGISDAEQYGRATQAPERIWGARTYQAITFDRNAPGNIDGAQVTLLIEWEQEGYQGVMTYIFDLVMESEEWRISNIMH
jgi:hypothetical protein